MWRIDKLFMNEKVPIVYVLRLRLPLPIEFSIRHRIFSHDAFVSRRHIGFHCTYLYDDRCHFRDDSLAIDDC